MHILKFTIGSTNTLIINWEMDTFLCRPFIEVQREFDEELLKRLCFLLYNAFDNFMIRNIELVATNILREYKEKYYEFESCVLDINDLERGLAKRNARYCCYC
jgi:hypothetical protein